MRTVDLLVVGIFIGPAAVAAVGLGDVFARIVLQIALGLGAGTIALVSQSYGAGRQRYANVVTTQTVLLAGAIGIPITAIGWLIAEDFFVLLGASDEVVLLGTIYLQVIILSATFRVLGVMSSRALQGTGDTRTPVVINIVGTLTNILLTVVLVGGFGSIPAYGILGAAVGTAIGNTIIGVLLIGVFASGRFRVSFTARGVLDLAIAREILRIGFPQVIDRNLYALGDIPLNAIVLLFGTEANAAFQIGRRVQQYARMPAWGFSTASSALVGNHFGRSEFEESDRYGRGSVTLALLVSVSLGTVIFVLATPIGGLFTGDELTLRFATEWIRVLAIATVFDCTFEVLRGGLQGAGDTRWPLYASLVGIGGFSLAFSYVVGVELGVGILGVYLGIVLDYAVRSLVVSHRFLSGSWKHIETDATRGTPVE